MKDLAEQAEKELKTLVDDAIDYRDLKTALNLEKHKSVYTHYIRPLQNNFEAALHCIKHLVIVNSVHDRQQCGICITVDKFIMTGKFRED